MTKIRSETRAEAPGEPEVWVNFEDVLCWLDELPKNLDAPIAATVIGAVRSSLSEEVSKGLAQSMA